MYTPKRRVNARSPLIRTDHVRPPKTTTTPASSATAKPSSSGSWLVGFGSSKGADVDVTVGKVFVSQPDGAPAVEVTVTNHSSTPANYTIEIALEPAVDTTQLGWRFVYDSDVGPGQTSTQTVEFGNSFAQRAPMPPGAKAVIKQVYRSTS